MPIRLPNNNQRTVLIGRTGTGKTVAGLWHLSNYSMTSPWVVFDFKLDEHINSIEHARHTDLSYIPTDNDEGLFVIHPLQGDTVGTSKTQSAIERYIWELWRRENCGIFCDEAFMVGDNPAFNACLTQGRSKHIPMIICTQRPAWVTRFAFSEADFFQVFHLNDARDKRTIESFTPIDYEAEERLEDHQSWYYDIGRDALVRFNPVPPMEAIRATFRRKLEKLPKPRVRI